MQFRDFHLRIILMVSLLSVISASCRRSISCPCGRKTKPLKYPQCFNNTFGGRSACKRWVNCETCEANTSYCLTCPKGRSGITCAADCGRYGPQSAVKISEDGNFQGDKVPWIVEIYIEETGSRCGGVVLDHTTVLTVASCLLDDNYATLYFGKYSRRRENDDADTITRKSSDILIHPEFDLRTFENNIAIVKFSPRVSYSDKVQPICMSTPDSSAANIVPGKTGFVIGMWPTEDRLRPTELMVAPVPIQASETCVEAYLRRNMQINIPPNMFCGGFADQENSVCRGASGYPLFVYDSDIARFILEGLVSHGSSGSCDQPERYTIFTRVSYFLQWILQNWEK